MVRVLYKTSMSQDLSMSQLVEILPPRIWYLTSNGTDMWCRRPYGFVFPASCAASGGRWGLPSDALIVDEYPAAWDQPGAGSLVNGCFPAN